MTITITLPEHIRIYIEKQVAEGRFDSEEAVIANAVEQAMGSYRWEEDEDLLEAIAEVDRGGGIEVGDVGEYFARLSGAARENAARGLKVSDDIKY